MANSYVKVYRSLLYHDLWLSERFTRGQAWIDLIGLAKWKPGFFYKRDIKVEYNRGEVTESIQKLSQRWRWSRGKVSRFLNDLQNEQQVRLHKSNVITKIELINYEKFQAKRTAEQAADEAPRRAADGHQDDTHKKVNKVNKEKKVKRGVEQSGKQKDASASKSYKGEPPSEKSPTVSLKVKGNPVKVGCGNVGVEDSFEVFWRLYDYKKARNNARLHWIHMMLPEERAAALKKVQAYIASTPNKQYRAKPVNWLRDEGWNDEIVMPQNDSNNETPKRLDYSLKNTTRNE